jgi:hypothetical protein
MSTENKFAHYPKTEFFEVVDTIGVPHPFCITHHHVGWASDHHCGQLGSEAIEAYEKSTGRTSCGVRGCNLKYAQHEQALLVRCKTKDNDLTKAYLESIVKLCEEDGYAGFTLLDGTGGSDENHDS